MASVKPMPKFGVSGAKQGAKSGNGNLFEPMSLSEIQPELIVYGPNGNMVTIDWQQDTKEVVQILKEFCSEANSVICITHGFWGNSRARWIHDLRLSIVNAHVESDQCACAIILGWGKGAELAAFKYSQAAINAEPVARWFSNHIRELKRKIGNKIKIWGIGEGIGAHLIGMAGRWSHAFHRITGLDPAGPAFELVNEEQMLCSSDAPFVDVIHTDSHHEFRSSELHSLINKYGTLKPCGTLDFYVNYGYDQPGASPFTEAGSHLRAIELFAWSIENPGELRTQFVLASAPEVDKPVTKTKRVVIPAELGYHADSKPTGNYYLQTNGEIPWKESF